WKGDVRAKSCQNIQEQWDLGQEQAIKSIKTFGISDLITDFTTWFTGKDNKDFLRPDGKKYVALSAGIDKSIADMNNPEDYSSLPLENQETLSFDGDKILAKERAEQHSRPPHSVFLEIGGKKIPKESAIRTLTDPGSDIMDGDSHDRTIRVLQQRTFMSISQKDEWRPQKGENGVDPTKALHNRDLFATFIRLNDDTSTVCLAVLDTVIIHHPTTGIVAVAPTSEVTKPTTQYTITGQLLSLLPCKDNKDSSGCVWDRDYIALTSSKAKRVAAAGPSRLSNLRFAVSGAIILPLNNMKTKPISTVSERFEDCILDGSSLPSNLEKTWWFPDGCLTEAWGQLLSRFSENVGIRTKIPLYTNLHNTNVTGKANPTFPYSSPSFSYSIPTEKTPLATALNSDKCQCGVCQLVLGETEIQNHVASHIWLAMRGISDDNIVNPVNLTHGYPCGFCGGQIDFTTGACTTRISWKGSKAESNCPLEYKFSVTAIAKRNQGLTVDDAKSALSSGKKLLVSTNIPMMCPVPGCSDIHWKYNILRHFKDSHGDDWTTIVPVTFLDRMQVTAYEQIGLGVLPNQVIQWPDAQLRSSIPPSTPRKQRKRTSTIPTTPSRSPRAAKTSKTAQTGS
ncbi:hypothetical protein V5O48_011948, partial [Marasmius crinis-equi]